MPRPSNALYLVYDKRALLGKRDGLPLLDRDENIKKAIKSAREWGGVCVAVAEDGTEKIVFVHHPKIKMEKRDEMTRRELMAVLRPYYGGGSSRRPNGWGS